MLADVTVFLLSKFCYQEWGNGNEVDLAGVKNQLKDEASTGLSRCGSVAIDIHEPGHEETWIDMELFHVSRQPRDPNMPSRPGGSHLD